MLNGKTWVLYFSLIPRTGSRIALHQDKQLEIAHAEKYCSIHMSMDRVQYTQSGRFSCDIF